MKDYIDDNQKLCECNKIPTHHSEPGREERLLAEESQGLCAVQVGHHLEAGHVWVLGDQGPTLLERIRGGRALDGDVFAHGDTRLTSARWLASCQERLAT